MQMHIQGSCMERHETFMMNGIWNVLKFGMTPLLKMYRGENKISRHYQSLVKDVTRCFIV